MHATLTAEEEKEYQYFWYQINQDRQLAQSRKNYRKTHPDVFVALTEEERIEYRRMYRLMHRGKLNAQGREWRSNNPKTFRRYLVESNHRRRVAMSDREDCSSKIRCLGSERFCHWCCVRLDSKNRTIDHVIPLSRGGKHIPDNLVSACEHCNKSKGKKLVSEWSWELAA